MKSLLIFLFFLHFFFIPIDMQASSETHRQVIFDCDGDIDDLIAILYLLKTEKADLKLVSTTSIGKSNFQCVGKNVLSILQLANKPNIPVSVSQHSSLSPTGTYPLYLRDPADSVLNIPMPYNYNDPVSLPSHEMIVKVLKKSTVPISIICTGPLTNIALAIKEYPEIINKIANLYILGGALNVTGNLIGKHQGYHNKKAEYNLFLDAKAAQIVFSSDVPITLIPLDALKSITPMPSEIYRTFVKCQTCPHINFVLSTMKPYFYPHIAGEANFWASLGVAHLLNPKIGYTIPLKLNINLEYGPYYGMLSIHRKGSPAKVCLSASYANFFEDFVSVFLGEP